MGNGMYNPERVIAGANKRLADMYGFTKRLRLY